MSRQSQLDEERLTFIITFPSDLNEDSVREWLSSISGTLKVGLSRIVAMPTIVFETMATDMGITHRLRAPRHDAAYAIAHLESLIPGTHVTQETEPLDLKWTIGAELGMSNPSRPLRISKIATFSTSILTNTQSLHEGEAILIQWVVGSSTYEAPPEKENNPQTTNFSVMKSLLGNTTAGSDEIEDRRKKLQTPTMPGVGRVAVMAPHSLRAKELIRAVLKDFSNASTSGNYFKEKHIRTSKLDRVINTAATPRFMPCLLNVDELIPVISWPIGAPYIAGLPQSRTRHMHVNNAVPSRGDGNTVVGEARTSGTNQRDVAIETIERMKHIHIIGPIGSGKTAEITNIAEQDMKDNFGVVLIETKGDLYHAVLERVPSNRWKDVIVWDMDDTEFPIGFNVLRQSSSRSAVGELGALIRAMYPESGLMTTEPLRFVLQALSEYTEGTFVDIPTFLSPSTDAERQWRLDIVKGLKNRETKRYWERYLKNNAKQQDVDSAPLRRRMSEFISSGEIRNSLGQSESSFYMEDVVRDGKILLINLNGVRIGQQTASLMGTFVMNAVWNAVRTTHHERPVILYMDEFQNFVTMPTSPSEMLAQSRSFGLGMVLAHQHTGQLKPELRDAVLANARSKIVFQTTANDARIMASEFGLHIRPEDFMNLQHREAIARVATKTGISQPFTMRTKDLSRISSNPRIIKAQSRAQYGRPVDEVEVAIDARRNPVPVARKDRAKIGEREWVKE